MPLPEDWAGVDWQPSLVSLPSPTEGYPTDVINIMKCPKYKRGYYMVAYISTSNIPSVGYIASDVSHGGKLVSQFVFMHEVGHHKLGHTGALLPDQMDISYTYNKELDADRYACLHWLSHRSRHGLEVIKAAIDYFDALGNAPGDAEHPAPAERRRKLIEILQTNHLTYFTIYNDSSTDPSFVREVLTQCFNYEFFKQDADVLISEIKGQGKLTLFVKANGQTIDQNEAVKITNFVRTKVLFSSAASKFRMTCNEVPVT